MSTPEQPPAEGLRQRIADTIRSATCEGGCGQSEEQCQETRIQPVVWHFGVLAEVSGTPEQIADALLPLFAAERAAAYADGQAQSPDETVQINGVNYRDAATARAAGAFSNRTSKRGQQ